MTMTMVLNLDFFWFTVATLLVTLGGFWGFRQIKTPFKR